MRVIVAGKTMTTNLEVVWFGRNVSKSLCEMHGLLLFVLTKGGIIFGPYCVVDSDWCVSYGRFADADLVLPAQIYTSKVRSVSRWNVSLLHYCGPCFAHCWGRFGDCFDGQGGQKMTKNLCPFSGQKFFSAHFFWAFCKNWGWSESRSWAIFGFLPIFLGFLPIFFSKVGSNFPRFYAGCRAFCPKTHFFSYICFFFFFF